MGIVYEISKERGTTIVLWDGVVSAKEFLAHVQKLSSDPNWPPPMRRHISDLGFASLDATMDESVIEEAAHLYGKQEEKIKNMAVAIVTHQEFDKAVAFERILLHYGARVIVFNFLGSACTWLALDLTEVGSVLQKLHQSLRKD